MQDRHLGLAISINPEDYANVTRVLFSLELLLLAFSLTPVERKLQMRRMVTKTQNGEEFFLTKLRNAKTRKHALFEGNR